MSDAEVDWSNLPSDVRTAKRELDQWLAPQEATYNSWLPRLNGTEDAIETRIEQLLSPVFAQGKDFQVTGQIKSWSSISEKLEAGRFAEWSDVTDLVRFRISTPSLGLVQKIRNQLDDHIIDGTIDEKRWWQTTGPGKGYAAVHFQFRYKKEDDVPGSQHLCGAEVQIQTNLQAAWSDLTHAFYKSSFLEISPDENYGAPALLREKVYRLAAALELLDEEIEAVKRNFPDERRRVIAEVENARWKSVELDEVALCSSMTTKFKGRVDSIRELGLSLGMRESAWKEHVRPGEESLEFLRFAERNGVRTLGDFSRVIHKITENPSDHAMRRIGVFIDLEKKRSKSIKGYLVVNRPLFLIALYLGVENPKEISMGDMMRQRMFSSYWNAIGSTAKIESS